MEPVRVKGFEVRVGDLIERERGEGEREVIDIVGDPEEEGGSQTVTTSYRGRARTWELRNDAFVWIVGER